MLFRSDELLEIIEDIVPGRKHEVTLKLPYSQSSQISKLHENQVVISEEYEADGILVKALIDALCYDRLREYVVK